MWACEKWIEKKRFEGRFLYQESQPLDFSVIETFSVGLSVLAQLVGSAVIEVHEGKRWGLLPKKFALTTIYYTLVELVYVNQLSSL